MGRSADTHARSLSALVTTLQQLGQEIEGTRRSGSAARSRGPGDGAKNSTLLSGGRGALESAAVAARGGVTVGGTASDHNAMLDMASAQLELLKERLSKTLAKSSKLMQRADGWMWEDKRFGRHQRRVTQS